MRNELLRHSLSTINYRFQKSVENVENEFGSFYAGNECRTPKEIIHHMSEVINTTSTFILEQKFKKEKIEEPELHSEIEHFYSELKELDRILCEKELEINFSKRLLQGPLSDVLTHIGQITMLRRLSRNPIESENFASATVTTGIV